MVQVDVFWAYGFGASLALAAGPKLATMKKPLESRYMVWTVLFLALIWSPTGMLLLLRHPSWETMQAAENFSSMNEFLVLAFGITNVTQGILGFWVGCKLIQNKQYYLANLNWMLGYFGMFFILVYGWDGLGYDRFFYDRDMLSGAPAWTPGAGTGATIMGTALAAWKFMTSSVAMTLYLDGLYLLPPFAALMFIWHRDAVAEQGRKLAFWRDGTVLLAAYLVAVFVVSLGAAIFSAVVVNYVGAVLGVGEHVARGLGTIPATTSAHIASYVVGLPLALAVLWFTVLKPGGLVNRALTPWCLDRISTPSSSSRIKTN
ncbi:MAG: hypothetical protein Q8J78_06910 [Moraxellaceae bacterium]|nr:hypothetical protein [Moraxellaceae bacterium]